MSETQRDRAEILLVEDDPQLQRIMRDALARDFAITCADDGRSGLDLALALRPDLVVTDLHMPRMTGEELVRELRSHLDLDDIPILVVTATLEDERRLALYRAGAQDFLLKPFSLEELRVRVSNLAQMKRVRDLLRDEVDARGRDVEVLAREITQKNRDLHDALGEAEAARALAERASRSKSTFLALATHELRTPLASLRLQLDLLQRFDALSEDRRRALVRRMDGSYRRLHDLIESLLVYAASGRQAVAVRPRDGARGDVATAVVGRALEEASRKGVQLAAHEEDGPVHVRTDPMLVQLALTSLVANAVRFTERGSVVVRVRSSEDGANARITIEDTGPGIATDDRARIFEPFERVESEGSESRPGLGLGLAFARDLVRALGGTLELESELGRGSRFTIVLPVQGVDTADEAGDAPYAGAPA